MLKKVLVQLKIELEDSNTESLFSFLRIFYYLFALNEKSIEKYSINSIATKDIIAFKDFKYYEDILDKDLRDKIIKTTTPEYDLLKEVREQEYKQFTQFFQNLTTLDLKKEQNVSKFIKDNNLKGVEVSDIVKLGINNDINYFVELSDIFNMIYDEGIYKIDDFNKILTSKQIVLEDYEKKILKNFIKPNLTLNKEKTESKIDKNINELKNVAVQVKKGDIIVREGEVITNDVYSKLVALGVAQNYSKFVRNIFSVMLVLVINTLFYLFSKTNFKKSILSNGFYPTLILFIFINILSILAADDSIVLYLIPFASLSIIANLFTKDKIFAFTVSTMCNIFLARDLEWFILICILSIIAINKNDRLTNRLDLVKNGFTLGAYQAFFALIYSAFYFYDFATVILMITFSLISGFLTGMICSGLIPYFEDTFKILTDIKLLELGDYSFPLLKRLLIEAPGTFYHSIMVGALAEQAAVAIGANPILARVGAYYHDIGKLKRPIYFVENQGGLENLHNQLKPSLSALLLTSHPKDGYILAKQYGLPEELLNIIIEHHGTTMVQYFYYKAVEIGENVNETDFRYQGPKPSTKESAIVMLADTVEAAIRASSDKSKSEIENTIRYLIKYKIDDNQLNECDIKLDDIEKIVHAFLQVLKAAYHERIQYPKIKQK